MEGDQGIKKSSAFRVLGGDWYTDDRAQFGSKDASLGVAGVWILAPAWQTKFFAASNGFLASPSLSRCRCMVGAHYPFQTH